MPGQTYRMKEWHHQNNELIAQRETRPPLHASSGKRPMMKRTGLSSTGIDTTMYQFLEVQWFAETFSTDNFSGNKGVQRSVCTCWFLRASAPWVPSGLPHSNSQAHHLSRRGSCWWNAATENAEWAITHGTEKDREATPSGIGRVPAAPC